MTARARRLGWLPVLLLAAVALAILRPWTVRPLDAGGAADAGPQRFDPDAFVQSIWSDGVLAAGVRDAGPVDPKATAPAFFRGVGRVVEVDTASRAGAARIDLIPEDGKADVALQVGPVMRGTALRDALGLGFADFDSQIDYADIADRLNARAAAGLPLLKDPGTLTGQTVAFAGAGRAGPDGTVELLPVTLEIAP